MSILEEFKTRLEEFCFSEPNSYGWEQELIKRNFDEIIDSIRPYVELGELVAKADRTKPSISHEEYERIKELLSIINREQENENSL